MKTLIVEDQQELAHEIKSFLEKESYVCESAHTFKQASELISINSYDFILIDLGLPDGDGLVLLEEAKKTQETAIFIIITARGEIEDKVTGLLSGADDYLAKPFSFLELKARMQAILRRKSGWKESVINIKGFTVDPINRSVKFNEEGIALTRKEFDILLFLLIHKNKVVNRYQLAEHIWGDFAEDDHQSNFIDVHVKNIRKKLGKYSPTDWLETIRGIGYKIES